MPTLSVIIPNYNHAPFLKERIDSVLNQTFQDFELIIMDDCSTDNSKEIIEGYRSDRRVTHIGYNENNSGTTFKQWQKGIELAKGKYIWIAESDDWCEPTLLEELVKGIKCNQNIVISYCGSVVVKEGGEILYTTSSKNLSEVKDGVSFIKNEMTEINPIVNASMAIFRKEIFQHISLEFTTFKFCGDWLFWIKLAQKGNVYISGKYLNYFRKHNADVSRRAMADGTYFSEYPRLVTYLFENALIDKEKYQVLLFAKYKKLKKFNGSETARKNLLNTYKQLIGAGRLTRLIISNRIHNTSVKLWIATPLFIKNIVRKGLPERAR
jgi:glycosyltransferase involved in cell wall biosynthesis